jgi:uncharacterized membrane protein
LTDRQSRRDGSRIAGAASRSNQDHRNMIARLRYLHEQLKTSIWLIPVALSALSALLAITMLWVDRWSGWTDVGPNASLGFAMPVSSARQVIGVIAGSIISVGGVAFSVTMVALTLTSGQYGPKVLRNFLDDDASKLSLGLFLGTYVYCIVLLTGFAPSDTPRFAVAAALVLAFVTLLAFVSFIHSTATNLQADQIVHRIGRQLQSAMAELADPDGHDDRRSDTLLWRRAARSHRGQSVAAEIQGYVQSIEYPALLKWCVDRQCVLQVGVRAGDLVVEGTTLFRVFGCSQKGLEAGLGDLRACILAGPMRTPIQDPEFAITQLNQLAARALSPGINDPGTAVTCVDWFSVGLSRIIDKAIPGSVFLDADGKPRLLAKVNLLDGVLKSIYAPLRQAAREDLAVGIRLIESLCRLAQLTRRDARLRMLAWHGTLIWKEAQRASHAPEDLEDMGRRHTRLMRLTRGAASW